MDRNKLYLLLGSAMAVGYAYLTWVLNHGVETMTPCPIKNATGIPCPSCGATRSVESIANGEIVNAAFINPLGFLIAAVMLIIPLWLLYDVTLKKDTLYFSYIQAEKMLKAKPVAIIVTLLVVANWIWNINKGL